MTKIVAVITQFAHPERAREALLESAQTLSRSDEERLLFEKCYEVAARFTFSPSFRKSRTVTWLGKVAEPAAVDVRCDHFLVENAFHGSRAVHQHIAFREPLNLEGQSEDLSRFVRILHEIYWKTDHGGNYSTLASQLDPITPELKDPAVGAADLREELFGTRGFYISVHGAAADTVAGWRTVAVPLYSLLFLHAEGVEPDAATRQLERAIAQSTSFFVSFLNADAILSLSTTYPKPALIDPFGEDYPFTTGSVAATSSLFESRCSTYAERFEPYDLLPEYPALRYLDLAVLEFGANAQHAQWRIRNRLDAFFRSRLPIRLIRATFTLPQVDRIYYRSTSFSILRLPVIRELGKRLVAELALDFNERAIDGMKASLLNSLVTLLTAAALLIGIGQLMAAILQ
jgi:hypothetical protein